MESTISDIFDLFAKRNSLSSEDIAVLASIESLSYKINKNTQASSAVHLPFLMPNFDRDSFQDFVATFCPNLINLDLQFIIHSHTMQLFIGIFPDEALNRILYLNLSYSKLSDISSISQLHSLQFLNLHNSAISDISPLSTLQNLKSLNLSETDVSNISPLSNLHSLQSLDLSETAISDISPLSTLQNLKSLNLSETAISDISLLSSLHNLQSLYLSSTDVSDISPLGNLHSLQSLDLSSTDVSDISPLGNLHSLQSLILSSTIISNISSLSNLQNLQSIHLDYTNISDISPLSNLHNIRTLELDSTNISDISPLSNLHNIRHLDLASNFIENISPLSDLKNLYSLDLSDTAISDILPLSSLHFLYLSGTSISDISSLSNLQNLQYLDLEGSSVSDISSLNNLYNLESLDLNHTKVSDISSLSSLHNLHDLNLNYTEVSDISPLSNLQSLHYLEINHTKVSDISSLSSLHNLQSLSLCALHLVEIPRHFISSNVQLVLDNSTTIIKQPKALFDLPSSLILSMYYDQRKIPVQEGKVIFLGDSGVGKTHTIQRILQNGDRIPPLQDSTQGIQTHPYKISESHHTVINFWDFGGQQIQQSMHQCFLTERACYVVVVSNRDPDKSMSESMKWLRTINSFSSQVSVLLLINQWSTVPAQFLIDETNLRKICPQLTKIIYYSALDDDQDSFNYQIINAINNQVLKLDSIQLELPVEWASIRQELLDSPDNYISMDTFYQLCATHGLGGETDAMISIRQWLLNWFNDLGICFSYNRSPIVAHSMLTDYKLLKPNWLTNGIYRLVVHGRTFSGGGIISRNDINEILSNPDYRVNGVNIDYTPLEAGYILEVMRKLGRSYEYANDSEFIPSLLDAKSPENAEPTGYTVSVIYLLEFSWLPRLLLHRMMTTLLEWSDGVYWLTGFRLRDKNTCLLITIDEEKNHLYLKLFKNDENLFCRPFHEALSLAQTYADDMGLTINQENIIYESDGYTAQEEFFSVFWDYLDYPDSEVRAASARTTSRRPKIPVKKLILPFYNDEMCKAAQSLNKGLGCEIDAALNAVAAVYPYDTVETMNRIRNTDFEQKISTQIAETDFPIYVEPSQLVKLASIAIRDKYFVDWLKINGLDKEELMPVVDENLEQKRMELINRQLYTWAINSHLYMQAVGQVDRYLLADALGPNETRRYDASINLITIIWKQHPELGLMPPYDYFSKLEYSRAFYKGYRDHVTHMLKVYLLGLYLYEKEESIRTKISNNDFFPIWTITALWHDIGYLFETEDGTRDGSLAQEAIEQFNDLLSVPITKLFFDSAFENNEKAQQSLHGIHPVTIGTLDECEAKLSSFESFGNSVGLALPPVENPIEEYYRQIARPRKDRSYYDHGIVSAYMLLFLSDTLLDYMESSKKFTMNDTRTKKRDTFLQNKDIFTSQVQKAAIAIALHNISIHQSNTILTELNRHNVTLSDLCIKLDNDPFAWLLRVCDETQCWDRQPFTSPVEQSKKNLCGNDLWFENEQDHPVIRFKSQEDLEKLKSALTGIIRPVPSFLQ